MKISQSAQGAYLRHRTTGDTVVCENCPDKLASHMECDERGWHFICCACHVASGEPPADWHPDCLAAEHAIKEGA